MNVPMENMSHIVARLGSMTSFVIDLNVSVSAMSMKTWILGVLPLRAFFGLLRRGGRVGGMRDKVYWSKPLDPEKWESDGSSFWCPKIIQPLVIWILRKLGFQVIA